MFATGGAIRDMTTGHWRFGCYQRAFRNYTLAYHEGYDESIHGCVICDHIDGPFVIETKRIQKMKFDNSLNSDGVFEDFFLRLGQEQTSVCPDVMFHIRTRYRSKQENKWLAFAKVHEIHKLNFLPGFEITFACTQPYICHTGQKFMISPCCMSELTNMTLSVMKWCEKNDIICELNGGTILAALKMNQLFPWDVDSDISFLLKNYTVLSKRISQLNVNGFKISRSVGPSYKNGKLVLGAFNLNSKRWFAEIWGKEDLASTYYTSTGRNPTKALLLGSWVAVPANPGIWVHDRYGHNLYKHAEHWRHLGGKHMFFHINADIRRFRACKTPGDHKCLDNYNADGDLQFTDPIP